MTPKSPGRRKRALFSEHLALTHFNLETGRPQLTPVVSSQTPLSRMALALALIILTAGSTYTGIFLEEYILVYTGTISMIVVILWFIYVS